MTTTPTPERTPAHVFVDVDRVMVSLSPATAQQIAEDLARADDRWDPLVVDLIFHATNLDTTPGYVAVPLLGTAS